MLTYKLAIFAPLLGSICGLILTAFSRYMPKYKKITDNLSWVITVGFMIYSAIFAVIIFFNVAVEGNVINTEILYWMNSGSMYVKWSLFLDTISALMIMVVTIVSTLVHIYSFGYMHGDKGFSRFMSYLSLFTFCMLMLVTSNNLVQMFFGWEGVGLCSYLLIGFWFQKESANKAAMKAFIVNRVGDISFALGIFGIFILFNAMQFDTIFSSLSNPEIIGKTYTIFGYNVHAITIICLLLLGGAMGKSAQLGLHTWLPDAMEGPTPVSALIHAATMVTAGVFMIARLSPIFVHAPFALMVITIVGALTAIFAATIGCVQNDIKRIIAYSTCSQLGYMFFALGVGAFNGGIFHLMTHAFFKALLFLGAGAVIHSLHHEQDIRKMGGIWHKIPITYVFMWIGSLALAGIPPFAGYYSKDFIIESAWNSGSVVGMFAYIIGIIVAFLTAFYSWRLLILVFHGKTKLDEHQLSHVKESPLIMLFPLLILSIGAIFAGMFFKSDFIGETSATFWKNSIVLAGAEEHEISKLVYFSPLIAAILGIILAYVNYVGQPNLPVILAKTFPKTHKFLLNKWYIDELYNFIFVKPAYAIGRNFSNIIDASIIDKLGPNGVASVVYRLSRVVTKWQSGYVYHYALVTLIGSIVFIGWFLYYGVR